MAVSNYEYPRLRRPEITTILLQFQIANVTEQDLSNPNPDLISNLYTRILIHLDFLLEEDNEQLDFDDLEPLENPDLHVESVHAIKLYRKIKELLNALECPRKFTLADLLMPDPQKTDFFLGALLNFCLDRDSRMNSISEIVDEFNALEVHRTELEESRILQLKSEISECNEAREREMPFVQEVDAKVNKLRHQTIAALNNEQLSLRTTLKKLDDKTKEMDQKISNAEFTLIQSNAENANLRSKIAQSPDKVQRALEDKKLAREEGRNAERLAMQTFHEKSALVEVSSKVNKKMSKHYQQMQAVQEQVNKKMSKHYQQMQAVQEQVNSAKSIEKDLKELKAKLSDEEGLEKSLEAKLVERQSKVEQMEELGKQLEKECSIMCEEATKYLSSTKLEVESKRCTLETGQRKVETVLSEVDAINSKITSVKELASVKVEQLDCKCEEIVEEFQKYASSISRVSKSGPGATERGGFDVVDPI